MPMSKFIKKFISLLVLFFLIHIPLQAGNFVKLPKDVASGNKKKEKDVPTQVVYFDEVRAGKTKEKVVGNLPPLN